MVPFFCKLTGGQPTINPKFRESAVEILPNEPLRIEGPDALFLCLAAHSAALRGSGTEEGEPTGELSEYFPGQFGKQLSVRLSLRTDLVTGRSRSVLIVAPLMLYYTRTAQTCNWCSILRFTAKI